MGFKIQSVDNLKKTANRMSECAVKTRMIYENVYASIETLSDQISGMGVEKSLRDLNQGVMGVGTLLEYYMGRVSEFIYSQVGSYATNEEELSDQLDDIQNLLDGITI